MAAYKEYPVTGEIRPLSRENNTRLRISPSTFTTVIRGDVPFDAHVVVDKIHEYTETVINEYVRAGDKWGHVLSINGVPVPDSWMAEIYLSSPICRKEYTAPVSQPKTISITVTETLEDGSTTEPVLYVPFQNLNP